MSTSRGRDGQHKKAGRGKAKVAMMALFLLFAVTVCLYLARLEAHTRADIFLPMDYHAMLKSDDPAGGEPARPDGELLIHYYQRYASQQGRPYTIRQDLLLSRLAYIKAPEGFRGETDGVTVQALCGEMERMLDDPSVGALRLFGRSRQEILELTAGIGEHPVIGELTIRAYFENPSGLAGYVLENDGELTITLRGSDDVMDTLDNALLLPFNLSGQYADMRELLATYGSAGRIWLTGHSKGGHNAIYAASIDARCRATGFNAPGFGIFLSDAQHDGLDHGVNYVINGDVTGFLLFHLERRIVLESAGSAPDSRHRLDNFFAVDDLTVAARIQPLSRCSEWITQILWLLLVFLAVYAMLKLLRKMYRRVFGKRTQRE